MLFLVLLYHTAPYLARGKVIAAQIVGLHLWRLTKQAGRATARRAAMSSRKRLSSSACSTEEGQENNNRMKTGAGSNLAQECESFLQSNGLQVLISSAQQGPLGPPFW